MNGGNRFTVSATLALLMFSATAHAGAKCDGSEKCTAATSCQIGDDCILILGHDNNVATVQAFVNGSFQPLASSDFFCVNEGTSIHWTAAPNEFFDVRVDTSVGGTPFDANQFSVGGDSNAPAKVEAVNDGCFPFLVTVCDIPANASVPVTCKSLDPKVVVQGGQSLYVRKKAKKGDEHPEPTRK